MKNQTQCPHCGNYNIANISARHMFLIFGGTSVFLGLFLAIFIIGIPFLAVGIVMLLIGVCVPDSGKRRCKTCWMAFKAYQSI